MNPEFIHRHTIPYQGMGTSVHPDLATPGIRLFSDDDDSIFVEIGLAIVIAKILYMTAADQALTYLKEALADFPEALQGLVTVAGTQPELAEALGSLIMHAVMDAQDYWPEHPAIVALETAVGAR